MFSPESVAELLKHLDIAAMGKRWQIHTRSLISYLGYLGVAKGDCIHSHKNHDPAPTFIILHAVIDEVTEEAVRYLRRPSV